MVIKALLNSQVLPFMSWCKQAWALIHANSWVSFPEVQDTPDPSGISAAKLFHSSQLTLWKYSPNLVDWDNSVSYAIHTKDVQEVEYFLAEFKIIRFSFSMNSN